MTEELFKEVLNGNYYDYTEGLTHFSSLKVLSTSEAIPQIIDFVVQEHTGYGLYFAIYFMHCAKKYPEFQGRIGYYYNKNNKSDIKYIICYIKDNHFYVANLTEASIFFSKNSSDDVLCHELFAGIPLSHFCDTELGNREYITILPDYDNCPYISFEDYLFSNPDSLKIRT